jgi:hypothetical protein
MIATVAAEERPVDVLDGHRQALLARASTSNLLTIGSLSTSTPSQSKITSACATTARPFGRQSYMNSFSSSMPE